MVAELKNIPSQRMRKSRCWSAGTRARQPVSQAFAAVAAGSVIVIALLLHGRRGGANDRDHRLMAVRVVRGGTGRLALHVPTLLRESGSGEAWYDVSVTRTTISIDEQTLRELQRLAAERGISLAALIREALDEKMARCEHPRPRSIGIGDSGTTDLGPASGEARAVPRSWR